MRVKTKHPGFEKDMDTQLLIGTDESYTAYLKAKNESKRKTVVSDINKEVGSLKKEVHEMKDMLQKILNGINK